MPIKRCFLNGRPGFKYGDSGKCYTYEPGNEESKKAAMAKAQEQRKAVKVSQSKRGEEE